MQLYVLYETASGYALFEKEDFDEVSGQLKAVQKSIGDVDRFTKQVKLAAYQPFTTAEEALENIQAIAHNKVSDTLKAFLQANLPSVKSSKKQKFQLGICEPKLGPEITEACGVTASYNETITEIVRGCRVHFNKILKKLKEEDVKRAQLGLAHSYSRDKCAQDVNRMDKPIIQTIALIEQMDKNINTFCMRLKEWFSWHFPELAKIITDNQIYVKLVHFIQNREGAVEENLAAIEEITLDEDKAKEIIEAAKISMGTEFNESDEAQIRKFCVRVVEMVNYREGLGEYLKDRMTTVAPNLTALIGENVGSKLISHSGSLVNLAKYPASTIQILGAEKALFRALKTKGKTPKYGLIFNSTFIGRAGTKNKGRISRYLANKCAIASRLDSFSVNPNERFGIKLREQMEERLLFLATGTKPKKNSDAMKEVLTELKDEGLYWEAKPEDKKRDKKAESKKEKKSKKAKKVESDSESEEEVKAKKSSKKRKATQDIEEDVSEVAEKPKKKKKRD
jgi:nucleolar protein 56